MDVHILQTEKIRTICQSTRAELHFGFMSFRVASFEFDILLETIGAFKSWHQYQY